MSGVSERSVEYLPGRQDRTAAIVQQLTGLSREKDLTVMLGSTVAGGHLPSPLQL